MVESAAFEVALTRPDPETDERGRHNWPPASWGYRGSRRRSPE